MGGPAAMMRNRVSAFREWRLGAVALLLIGFTTLAPAAFAARTAEEQVAHYGFAPGQVGYLLVDLETGERLDGGRVDDLFIPASTAKVPSVVAALDVLGPGYRPRTELWATGLVVAGVLQGDLYLRGMGDPFLDTNGLKDLVGQLADAGISGVTGTLYYDPGRFPSSATITPSQPITAGYNPGVSALSVNFNRVHLEWVPEGAGIDTTVYAYADSGRVTVDWIDVANGGSFGALLDYGSEDSSPDNWIYADSLHGEGGTWLPVRSPAYHTAMLFRTLAAAQGLTLAGPIQQPTPANADLVAMHLGDSLAHISAEVLEHSNNLAAELVGLATARQLGGPLAGVTHAARTSGLWLQQNIEANWSGYQMENHSGLSSTSRISPAQMCAVLAYADRMDGVGFFDLLSAVNWESNLNQNRPSSQTRIQVRAKTGTMAYGVGLAGYIIADSGRRLAFAVFVSDIEARNALDAVLDLRDSSTPAAARPWFNRARELERAIVRGWAETY